MRLCRDSVRISDVKNIQSSLEYTRIKSGNYGLPDTPTQITYSGGLAWTQGTFGETNFKTTDKLSKLPVDPLTENFYTYSVSNNQLEYELGAVLEGGQDVSRGIAQETHAGSETYTSYIKGNYNGQVLKVSTGSTQYVLALPTIISGDITTPTIEYIATNKHFAVNGYKNIPTSYGISNSDSNNRDFVNPTKLVTWSGTTADLENENNLKIFADNLQEAYTGTLIAHTTEISNLFIDTTDTPTLKKTIGALVNTRLGGEIAIPSTSSTPTLTGWRAIDTNCTIDDITVGTQTWAGCNSTLGDGFEWGKRSDGTDGSIGSCYNYDGASNVSDCAIGSSNMASNTSAKAFFDLEQPDGTNTNGDAEYDTIWGKLYTWSDSPSACPTGRHVPSDTEWTTLENHLAGTTCRTGNGWQCDGLGWNGASGAKNRTLANTLLLPLAGYRYADGATFYHRGHYTLLWSSTPSSSNAYHRFLYWDNSTVTRNVYSQADGFSVRCIKD